MRLSSGARNLAGQGMFSILAKAKSLEAEGIDVIHMELGDPDMDTPQYILDAAEESLESGETHYCPSTGLPELKVAAQKVTVRSRGFKPELNQLLPTIGANSQLFAAMWCTMERGETVLLPDPCFPSYEAAANLAGLKIKRFKLSSTFKWIPQIADLRPLITPQTRMLVLNSPGNPTGGVIPQENWHEIYDFCVENGLWLLSDEVYSRMIWNGEFYSPSMIDGCRDRCIIVNGFSKSFGMTGWRLGVVTAPSFLIEKMALCLESIYSCVPAFVQRAGVAALEGDQTEVMARIGEYKERRDVLVEGLKECGFEVSTPRGGLYVFAGTSDGDEAAKHLLEGHGIACCPGSMFGEAGKKSVRFSFACEPVDRIREAIGRMKG